MEELKLIEQDVKNNPVYKKHWIVKNGRKKYAQIFCRINGEYSVTINNSCTWIKNSFIECIDICNEMAGRMFFEPIKTIKND